MCKKLFEILKTVFGKTVYENKGNETNFNVGDNSHGKTEVKINKAYVNSFNNTEQSNHGHKEESFKVSVKKSKKKNTHGFPYDILFEDYNGDILINALLTIKNYMNIYGLKLLLFSLTNLETNLANPDYLTVNKSHPTIDKFDLWLKTYLNETKYVAFAEYQLGFEELKKYNIIDGCFMEDLETQTDQTYFYFPELIEYLNKHKGSRIIMQAIKSRSNTNE